MTSFKEFQGKTLDEAIQEACNYYGVGREKLEVEILNDAKTGIFGLVSVKKAKIRASKLQIASLFDDAEDTTVSDEKVQSKSKPNATKKTSASKEESEGAPKKKNTKNNDEKKKSKANTKLSVKNDSVVENAEVPSPEQQEKKKVQTNKKIKDIDEAVEGEDTSSDFSSELVLEDLDESEVIKLATETLRILITPIVGDAPLQITIEKNRIRAHVDCGEDSGLLVGREGVTLAALQYIAGRVMAKELGGAVRLHIDAGDYRERQDIRLTELALSLAEKAKETGKSQATRLLSAYQRRLVHLALEGDEAIQTLSKGEGGKRRVIIQLRKGSNKKSVRNKSEQDEVQLSGDSTELPSDDPFLESEQE